MQNTQFASKSARAVHFFLDRASLGAKLHDRAHAEWSGMTFSCTFKVPNATLGVPNT